MQASGEGLGTHLSAPEGRPTSAEADFDRWGDGAGHSGLLKASRLGEKLGGAGQRVGDEGRGRGQAAHVLGGISSSSFAFDLKGRDLERSFTAQLTPKMPVIALDQTARSQEEPNLSLSCEWQGPKDRAVTFCLPGCTQ